MTFKSINREIMQEIARKWLKKDHKNPVQIFFVV